MSKRVLILVEGQTEERFVKDVFAPYFFDKGLFFHPTILMTKRVKDGTRFKGGVTNFAKFANDAERLLNSAGGALVTTMLDYYRLPNDFPGMNSRPNGTPIQRVKHLELALVTHFGSRRDFLPFLALHEFEAWLFSSVTELSRALTEPGKEADVRAIRDSVNNPEEINERPELAPSKRLQTLFPAYKKALHGPLVARRIGLNCIRAECPHFNEWIEKLETFAASSQ